MLAWNDGLQAGASEIPIPHVRIVEMLRKECTSPRPVVISPPIFSAPMTGPKKNRRRESMEGDIKDIHRAPWSLNPTASSPRRLIISSSFCLVISYPASGFVSAISSPGYNEQLAASCRTELSQRECIPSRKGNKSGLWVALTGLDASWPSRQVEPDEGIETIQTVETVATVEPISRLPSTQVRSS
jgi:hypothetical protein